jgi:arylsulfatase A
MNGRWLFGILATVVVAVARQPNMVVVMADDIGASELAGYGHPTHRTPNLDALGRTGVQFATCFTAPVCHPTRFTLMTGRYGFRTGVLNFSGKRAGPPRKHEGADDIATHLTFAQPLRAAG